MNPTEGSRSGLSSPADGTESAWGGPPRQDSGDAERPALALDASSTSIRDFDMVCGFVTFDAGWARMLGQPPTTIRVTVRKVFALVHPEERARAQQSVQDCLTGAQDSYDREYRVNSQQGAWVWVHSRGRVTARAPTGRAPA